MEELKDTVTPETFTGYGHSREGKMQATAQLLVEIMFPGSKLNSSCIPSYFPAELLGSHWTQGNFDPAIIEMTEMLRINYCRKVFNRKGGEGIGDSIDCVRFRLSADKEKT